MPGGNMSLPAKPAQSTRYPAATSARVSSLGRWVSLCPILYNAFESYKHRVGFHPHLHKV